MEPFFSEKTKQVSFKTLGNSHFFKEDFYLSALNSFIVTDSNGIQSFPLAHTLILGLFATLEKQRN